MKAKVTKQGVLIPKRMLKGVEEVEVRKEKHLILVVPVSDDPIFGLGENPVRNELNDASTDHDKYLYGVIHLTQ